MSCTHPFPGRRALRVVGLNHESSSLETRERAAVGASVLPEALETIGDGVILSTCNRTEVYRLASDDETTDPAETFFARRLGDASDGKAPHLYRLEHITALRHLFAVAAGLDSLVVGEAQILGQVRSAIDAARAAGKADDHLVRIFHQALRVGRRARAETFIGRHAVSVSYAAVELARSVLGNLREAKVLVVGAGEMGELTARVVVEHGAVVAGVANRTLAHAEAITARVGGQAVGLERLADAIAESDIVISSTDAPDYVVSRDAVAAAVARRRARPLLIVDIAVPRDVDPSVCNLDGVHLYDMDDLRAHCSHNQEQRRREVREVQRIIDAEVERFEAWWRTLPALPSVLSLRQGAEQIRLVELEEALARLRHLSPADRAVVDQLSRAIVNKLLHAPTVHLKDFAAAGDLASIDVVREAFDIA